MNKLVNLYESSAFFLIALCVFLLDQLSKIHIEATLAYQQSRSLWEPFLYLTYVRNQGAAFSLLWGHGNILSLIGLAVVSVVVVVHWRSRPTGPLYTLAAGLLVGGAIGNMYDRFTLGYVRDMVDLHWAGRNVFPIWNVADMAVVGAVGLFILFSSWMETQRQAFTASDASPAPLAPAGASELSSETMP